jgi:hypothetical protein
MAEGIRIEKLDIHELRIPIVGTSPLIQDNWSEWDRQQIRDANARTKTIKPPLDPQAEYLSTLYRIAKADGEEVFGHPSMSFQKATVGAARYYGRAVKMTELRQAIQIIGETTKADPQTLTEIFGEHQMREDRIGTGGGRASQLTYRAEFREWAAILRVRYVSTMIDADSVVSLVDGGGIGVGVGNWRPEKGGSYGCYTIDTSKEVEVVR